MSAKLSTVRRVVRIVSVMVRMLLLLFCLAGAEFAVADAVDAQSQSVTLALATEPPNLDSATTTDTISMFVLGHTMQGLLQRGPSGDLVAGVAERWQLTADGARFWLRENAKWSDGKPVTAHDFVFAWRRAVDPAYGSQYAFILYPLVNAEAINNASMSPEALGVTAINDYELQVNFAKPCPWFLDLTPFATFLPQRQDFVAQHGRAYGADADKLLFNGSFVLEKWVHGAALTLAKNPDFWNAENVRLSRIDMPYITSDASAQFNLFRDNQIAITALDRGILDDAISRGYPVKQFKTGALAYLAFNHRPGQATHNLSLRRAIQAVIDPALMVYKVIGLPGVDPAYSLFPKTVKGLERSFREEHPAPRIDYDVARARAFLAAAKSELGVAEIPPLILLAGESPAAAREAEFIQYVLQRALGLTVHIDKQTFKQRLQKMADGSFNMVMAAWGPDFDDAITFGDLFASWNDNNRGRYLGDEYDQQIAIANGSADQRVRFQAFARVQEIVVEGVVIIPLYERGVLYLQHPKLRGVRRSLFGNDPSLLHAWIEP